MKVAQLRFILEKVRQSPKMVSSVFSYQAWNKIVDFLYVVIYFSSRKYFDH